MKKIATYILTVLTVCLIIAEKSTAATAFSSPAGFEMDGSKIGFSMNVETIGGKKIPAVVSPNPAAVTGVILIDQLNQISGAFSGAFQNISTSVTATVQQLSMTVPISLNIHSSDVKGWFVWVQDAVIFDTSTLVADLTVGNQTVSIPMDSMYFPARYKEGVISIDARMDHEGEYLGRNYKITMVIQLVAVMNSQSMPMRPWIDLQTDRPEYQSGDHMTVTISAGGPSSTKSMDFYMALIGHDGTLYFAPDYTTTITPWLTNFSSPVEFYVPSATIFKSILPSSHPPVSETGVYYFAGGFAEAGTFNWVSDIEMISFSYKAESSGLSAYDGIWYGSGKNYAENAECSNLAEVVFEIGNGTIEGVADEVDGIDPGSYELTAAISGNGEISEGIIWEEFAGKLYQIGVFTGQAGGSSIQGTWHDVYGCYGDYTMNKAVY